MNLPPPISYTEMRERLLELQRQQMDLEATIIAGQDMIAALHGPYKVGQITEIRGYSHTGKQCRVTKVAFSALRPGHRWDKDHWKVFGVVLKKDGSDSLNTVDWREEVTP
jgi:hypothetical protein